MALLLAKKLSHSFPFATPHLRLTLLPLLHLSTEAAAPKSSPFLTQYLVSSFGFSPDRALKLATSSYLSAIKTPDRPEAVVRFLKETGLTDSQIKSLICWEPGLLIYNVSNTLQPRVQELMAAGFTGETLTWLIQLCPSVLRSKSASSRLQFWRNYVGTDDALLTMIRRNRRLLQLDIGEVVLPVMNLLKAYGFSDSDIRRLYLEMGYTFKSPDIAKKYIEETEALGFRRGSGMFTFGLIVVGKQNRDIIMRKLEFFRKNYGWSDEAVHTAFRKFPNFVSLSEETLKSKMDYLLGCGLTDQNIITNPSLLGYSLQRRLVPRHHVLSVLKMKGLIKNPAFRTAVALSENKFIEKFVRSFEKEVPDLEELYASLCQGNKCIQNIPEFQGRN